MNAFESIAKSDDDQPVWKLPKDGAAFCPEEREDGAASSIESYVEATLTRQYLVGELQFGPALPARPSV